MSTAVTPVNAPETPEGAEMDQSTGDDTVSPHSGTQDRTEHSTADESAENAESEDTAEDEPDTFPRDYVEKLRKENARYRERAGRADDLARRLHRALVEKTGRLADPADLPYDDSHLDDEDALNEALDALLASKPHFGARVSGDVGQGVRESSAGAVTWADVLRQSA